MQGEHQVVKIFITACIIRFDVKTKLLPAMEGNLDPCIDKRKPLPGSFKMARLHCVPVTATGGVVAVTSCVPLPVVAGYNKTLRISGFFGLNTDGPVAVHGYKHSNIFTAALLQQWWIKSGRAGLKTTNRCITGAEGSNGIPAISPAIQFVCGAGRFPVAAFPLIMVHIHRNHPGSL